MIPDEAVEAAAKAWFERSTGLSWDDETDQTRRGIMGDARAALEAAAPHSEPTIKPRNFYSIQAAALREAFHEFPLETITAPDNAAVWMKRRADDLDRKAERA